MFNLKKVKKARKRLEILTNVLFKLFQINLRYKEKRTDYGIEIFEYFYLPWKTDKEFNRAYSIVSEYTLNPKSRLYTLYEFSKNYLQDDTSFIEVGCWKGGASGLGSITNSHKNVDYFLCDTFTGVANSSSKDTFFKDNEYSDAGVENITELEKISGCTFNIVEGIFPNSFKDINIEKPISFAHIDVDTYVSAKESFEFISTNSIPGALIVLDDFGGWFTDGVTSYGKELMVNKNFFVVPNHLGQLLIFIK